MLLDTFKLFNPFTPKSDLIDFTLSSARRFYSSKGDPLGVKGLTQARDIFCLYIRESKGWKIILNVAEICVNVIGGLFH